MNYVVTFGKDLQTLSVDSDVDARIRVDERGKDIIEFLKDNDLLGDFDVIIVNEISFFDDDFTDANPENDF